MDRAFYSSLWRLADEVFRPCAARADAGSLDGVVRENIALLASRGFLGLGVAREYGGMGAGPETQHEYTEILASACGVTAFTQHQLRVGMKQIATGDNDGLKRRLLPSLTAGRLFCGVALSQIRRADAMVTAEAVPGGFRVNGTIPWITGWSLLDGFVLGAALDEGKRHLFAYVDREARTDYLIAGEPMPLVVMRASGTVAVQVRDLFVPDDDVVAVRPCEDLARSDEHEITAHAALPLGCALGCERYLRELGRDSLDTAGTTLLFEINHCRREALTWGCDCVGHPEYKKHALRVRAASLVLAMRAAAAAVTAGGGRSQLIDAAPQRFLREAQFYTTAVQTPEVQAAVLGQLFSPFFGM